MPHGQGEKWRMEGRAHKAGQLPTTKKYPAQNVTTAWLRAPGAERQQRQRHGRKQRLVQRQRELGLRSWSGGHSHYLCRGRSSIPSRGYREPRRSLSKEVIRHFEFGAFTSTLKRDSLRLMDASPYSSEALAESSCRAGAQSGRPALRPSYRAARSSPASLLLKQRKPQNTLISFSSFLVSI